MAYKALHTSVFNLEAPWHRIWVLRRVVVHPEICDFRAPASELPRELYDMYDRRHEPRGYRRPPLVYRDLLSVAAGIKLKFDAAELSGCEAQWMNAEFNRCLGDYLARDFDVEQFQVDRWFEWYKPDGFLIPSNKRNRT